MWPYVLTEDELEIRYTFDQPSIQFKFDEGQGWIISSSEGSDNIISGSLQGNPRWRSFTPILFSIRNMTLRVNGEGKLKMWSGGVQQDPEGNWLGWKQTRAGHC